MNSDEKAAAKANEPAAAPHGAATGHSVRESEERYKALVESTTDYIYVVEVEDGRPRKTIHGPGCIVVTGYATEDFDADPGLWYRMIHEEDRERVLRNVEHVLSGGYPPPFPHRIRHKDGSIRWVGVTLVPRFDEGHRVFAYDGLIRDITERKLAEDATAESERYLKSILDSMNVGVLIVDPATHTITDANRYALEMIGRPREEVLGRSCHGLVCTAETGACPVTDRGGTLDVTECVLPSRSGRNIPILKSVREIERKGKKVLIESFFNVEERQRAAEALRRSEEKFRIVADNTYDWEYWAKPEGGFVYISPSCEKLTGYPAADFESDPDLINRIVHAEDRERFREHRRDAGSKEQPEDEIEFRVVCRDGSEKWIAHVCQPVFDDEGRYLGARGSNRDITGRKAIEQERELLIAELQEALSKVKLLSGFLPICASCKKIRDDKGYWNQIESYIHAHSEAEFSHGLCPECARNLYPGYYKG